jgi:hypothetical protein
MLKATTARVPGPDGWPKICPHDGVRTLISDPALGIAVSFEHNSRDRGIWLVMMMFRVAGVEKNTLSGPVLLQLGMN